MKKTIYLSIVLVLILVMVGMPSWASAQIYSDLPETTPDQNSGPTDGVGATPSPTPTPTLVPESFPMPEEEPEVELKPEPPPTFCTSKKYCLFPFNLPYLTLQSLTYPIAYGGYQVNKFKKTQKIFNFLTNEQKDWSIYPKIWVGDGNNFGGGFGVSHQDLWDKDYKIRFEYMIFTNLAMRSSFIFGNPNAFYAFNRAFSFYFRSQFWRDFENNYFGVGNDSSESNRSIYSRNRVRAGFVTGFELIPNLVFAFQTFFDAEDTGAGKNGLPSVQQTFPPDELAGFDQFISYVVPGFRLVHDTRDNFINSQSGGRRRAKIERFQGVDQGGFNFWQFSLEAEQYIPEGPPRFVLWVRNRWVFQQAESGNQIPYYRLAQLDYNRGLRSFRSGRFRDRGSVVFNIEQRFPLWKFIDGALFFDTGRVFPGIKNFSFKDFKYSVGGGIRVFLGKYYVSTLNSAYGNDGFKLTLKIRHIFWGLDD